jgi:excisionase family DNA binding protein
LSNNSNIVKARIRQPVKGGRRYAKIAEAAEYLGVHEATIRQMMADGRLVRYSLGDRILRVDLNEIDAVMEPGKAAS